MNRLKNLIIIGLITILPIIIFIFNIKLDCIIKKYLHFACPGCGLTRAYQELLQLNIFDSFKYNICAIPLAVISLYLIIRLFIDTIKNKNNFINDLNLFLKRHHIKIIILLIIITIINNINTL